MDRTQIIRRTNARLTKRATGKYYVEWSECQGDTGKWRTQRVSTRETDRGPAQAFLNTWTAAQQELDTQATGDLIEALAQGYLAAAAQRGVGRGQEMALKAPRRFLGNLRVSQLTPERIMQYRTQDRPMLASGSQRRELTALVAVLNWGVRMKRITQADMPFIDLPPNGVPRQNFLTEDQEQQFLADALAWRPGQIYPSGLSWQVSWLGLFVAIGLDTGARHEAVMDLTWDRIDVARWKIDFRDPCKRETRKRRVSVPVASRLKPVLELAHQDAVARLGPNPQGAVFMPHTMVSPWRGFTRDYPQWAWVTPHMLRHTFITLSLRSGMSVWDVAGIVGASPTTVQQVYGHHSADDRARALLDRRHSRSTSGIAAA